MESFSFNHSLGEVNVNLTFVIPEYKLCMRTFAEMCARAAKAFGHMEQSVENYIHSPDDAFAEFDEECDCDCDKCSCEKGQATFITVNSKKEFG